MKLVKKPFYWSAAHSPIIFEYEYDLKYPISFVVDSGGFAMFLFTGDGIHNLSVGDYVYCDFAPYIGYHKITEIPNPYWYKVATPFVSGYYSYSGNVSFVEDAVFEIFSGFTTSPLDTVLPFTKVAEFKPEPNADGVLSFDISGYVNKLFDVVNSQDTIQVGALDVYYNLMNKILLRKNGAWAFEAMVINSALSQLELNATYVDTGISLNNSIGGANFYWSCGDTNNVIIKNGYVINELTYEDGEPTAASPDFNDNDFNSADFRG